LEIRSIEDKPKQGTNPERIEPIRERRQAAVNAASQIKDIFRDDN